MPDPSLDAIRSDQTGEIDEDAENEEIFYYRARRGYQLEKLRIANERLQHDLDNLRQDAKLRKRFARRISRLVIAWLLVVLAVLVMEGFKVRLFAHSFELSDSVLLALVGSTTANVIGIFLIVVHYLFPDQKARVS